MPRASWSGYLRMSLVSCEVQLMPAVSADERVAFHLLNPATQNRTHMRTVDAETGKEVPRSELVKGYEYEKDRYVVVTEEELEEIQVESTRVIDLARFVDRAEIDPVFYAAAYFMAPKGKMGAETFKVLRQALEESGKAAIGRVVLSTREHPVMIVPDGDGMLLITLHSAEEVRQPGEFFDDIPKGKSDPEMVKMAKTLIEQKTGAFKPAELTGDRYQEALHALVAAKIKGEPLTQAKIEAPSNVVNLMDALRNSLGKGKAAPAKKAGGKPSKGRPATAAKGGGKKGTNKPAAKRPARAKRKAS